MGRGLKYKEGNFLVRGSHWEKAIGKLNLEVEELRSHLFQLAA